MKNSQHPSLIRDKVVRAPKNKSFGSQKTMVACQNLFSVTHHRRLEVGRWKFPQEIASFSLGSIMGKILATTFEMSVLPY